MGRRRREGRERDGGGKVRRKEGGEREKGGRGGGVRGKGEGVRKE